MALRMTTWNLRSKLLPMFSPASTLHSHATSFGFKEVQEEEKIQLVGNVFSSVASNYDLMNDLMSGGLHRLWKDRLFFWRSPLTSSEFVMYEQMHFSILFRLVSKLNPFPGMKHLDVAGGTGDVAFRILETIKSVNCRAMEDVLEDNLLEETQIHVCDINPNMF